MDKIYYRHVRHTEDVCAPCGKLYDLTMACRIDHQNDLILIGIGVVSPHDQYSKQIGREHAVERLTYDPTFSLPIMHDNAFKSMVMWQEHVAFMSPIPVRDLVIKKQTKFDRTEFGISLKLEKQRQALEAAQKKEQEWFDSYGKYHPDRKPIYPTTVVPEYV